MEPVQLWAAVSFTAQNGRTEELLYQAAQAGLHLYDIFPCPGGFGARCPAGQYRAVASLARRCHVTLRVTRRCGLYFRLRPLLRRVGLWAGLVCFVPLLLWSQGLIWSIDCGGLTAGQQARVLAVLREAGGIQPGRRTSEALLTAGEYAILESGEFSWASLNFSRGRLTVEAAAANPTPEIFSGKLQGLHAKESGVVQEVNLRSGTALVVPGQEIEAGQELIGTARSERDGTLIFEPAAGTVRARFVWQGQYEQPLESRALLLTGQQFCQRTVSFLGLSWKFPEFRLLLRGGSVEAAADGLALTQTRHVQPELFGQPLPVSVEERLSYPQSLQTLSYSEEQARALARMQCLQMLYAEYPDAEFIARKETAETNGGALCYTVEYTVVANICG